MFQSALANSIQGAVAYNGFSNISHSADEVMLLKRFFDGFKIPLYRVK